MKNVFLSLIPDPPDGFEFRVPSRRDLRGYRIALLANTQEEALSLLNNFIEHVRGLVVTEGDSFSHTLIAGELWHLVVPAGTLPQLFELASAMLDMMSKGQTAIDQNVSLETELTLTRKILFQTRESYNNSTERLRRKVTEIRHILDNSLFGIFRTDVFGTIFFANPALLRIFGYSSIDAMNKVGLPNIYKNKSDREKLLLLAKQGPVKEFVTSFVRSDGTIIDILLTMYPVYAETAELMFLEGNLIDITERNLVLKELDNLRNYLSNIIDSMPSLLAGVDADGMVTLWNKTAEQASGISAELAKGKYLGAVFPEMSSEMEKVTASIRTGEIIQEKKRPVAGGTGFENITIFPLAGHEVKGAVIRIDDVSNEAKLEEQLSHSRKMDAIGQLAGGVAHDFNNMLGAIIGAAELLKSPEDSLDADQIEFVDMILKASTRAADLTTKLLAFGRKGKITSCDIDIHEVIADTVSILNSTIDKIISISVSNNADKHIVTGDVSGLHNAFINIGINASHAMPDGGHLSITTSNTTLDETYCSCSPFDIEAGEFVQIEIRDTGWGISADNLSRIFEPFYTTKKLGAGNGLGLPAVYGTVLDHYGAISVYSEENVGTLFVIFLPCSDGKAQPTRINPDVVTGSGQILLVDDEELIRKTGKLMLEEMGYTVILAENGQIAVEIFKENYNDIDLVIMDMIMPEMNGREAFFRMREIDSSSRIVICSGFSKIGDVEALNKKGLAGFIQKPYSSSELSKLLAGVLST